MSWKQKRLASRQHDGRKKHRCREIRPTGSMTAWKTPKAVLQIDLASTDGMSNHDSTAAEPVSETADGVLLDAIEVRVAAAQEIRPRFAEEGLAQIRDQLGGDDSQAEAQPGRVQGPELAAPSDGARRTRVGGAARNEDHAQDKEDDGRGNGGDEEEGKCRHLGGGAVGQRDLGVDQGEGLHVRRHPRQREGADDGGTTAVQSVTVICRE